MRSWLLRSGFPRVLVRICSWQDRFYSWDTVKCLCGPNPAEAASQGHFHRGASQLWGLIPILFWFWRRINTRQRKTETLWQQPSWSCQGIKKPEQDQGLEKSIKQKSPVFIRPLGTQLNSSREGYGARAKKALNLCKLCVFQAISETCEDNNKNPQMFISLIHSWSRVVTKREIPRWGRSILHTISLGGFRLGCKFCTSMKKSKTNGASSLLSLQQSALLLAPHNPLNSKWPQWWKWWWWQ